MFGLEVARVDLIETHERQYNGDDVIADTPVDGLMDIKDDRRLASVAGRIVYLNCPASPDTYCGTYRTWRPTLSDDSIYFG